MSHKVSKDDYIKTRAAEMGMTLSAFKAFLKKTKTKIEKCACSHPICKGWLEVNRYFKN